MGWKTDAIIGAMPGMLSLAAAGALDLGRAADITSDTMQAFGIESTKASHVADVFAYAQANANTNVEQMGDAMTYLAPVANAMGWSLEQSAAGIMAVSDAGVKGSMAGQAFATSMARLAKPTRAMFSTMTELNLELFDAQGNLKSLPNLVGELEVATKGMTREQKSNVLSTMFGAQAYKHWAILLERGSDELSRMTGELENADGAADRMAATMMDNLGGQWELFKSGMAEAAYSIYEYLEPALRDVVKIGIKFAAIIPPMTKVIAKFAKPFKPLGKAVLIALGAVASFIAMAVGLKLVALAFAFLLSPIGLVIAGLTALALGFDMAYKHIKPFRGFIDGIGRGLQGFWALLKGNEGKGISLLMSTGMTKETYFKIKHFADGLVKAGERLKQAKGAISGFFDAVKNGGGTADGLHKMLDSGMDASQVKRVYEFAGKMRNAMQILAGAFELLGGDKAKGASLLERAGLSSNEIATAELIADGISAVFERIKGAVKAAADFIGQHAGTIATIVGTIAAAFALVSGATFIIEGLAAAFAALTGPVGLTALAIAGIALAFKAAYEQSGPFKAFVDGIIGKFVELKNAIKTGDMGNIMETLGLSPEIIGVVTDAISSVGEAFTNIKAIITDFIGSLTPGIEMIVGAFSGFGETVASIFTTLMPLLSPILAGLQLAFQVVGDVISSVFNNMIAPAIAFTMKYFQLMWTVVGPVLELLGAAILVAFTVLQVVWNTILSPFVGFMTGIFKAALEAASPMLDKLGGAFQAVGGFISTVSGYVKDFASALSNVKIPDWVGTIGGKLKGAAGAVGGFFGGGAKSNYHGQDRVPYDGYLSRLHRGEKILTRTEADAYEGMEYGTASASVSNDNRSYSYATSTDSGKSGVTYQFGDINVNGVEGNMRGAAQELLTEIATLIEREGAQMA
ncbi:tail tape measure protein [Sporosarcina phage Lietuvens]|nr:tail tape measure protein [Sporosarcina phage Lietuvens]